jgi:hypothetical protein
MRSEPEGGRLGVDFGTSDVLGRWLGKLAVDDGVAVEADDGRHSPADGGAGEMLVLLHPPGVQLDVGKADGEDTHADLRAPGQPAPQVAGVAGAGVAGVAGQEPRTAKRASSNSGRDGQNQRCRSGSFRGEAPCSWRFSTVPSAVRGKRVGAGARQRRQALCPDASTPRLNARPPALKDADATHNRGLQPLGPAPITGIVSERHPCARTEPSPSNRSILSKAEHVFAPRSQRVGLC